MAVAMIVLMCWLLDGILPSPVPPAIPYSVQVVDRGGRLLRLFTTDDGYWRLAADSSRVDPAFIEQLLVYEDKRYRAHPGVDPLAVARAAMQWLSSGRIVSGASTITMQTVRLLQPRPRTLAGKFTEMVNALRLERRLDKKQILDLYLSLAPYGGNIQGVEAAARFYFNKDASRLNPSESALLISLPQSPETRRPDRHPQRAKDARLAVLQRLAGVGLLGIEDVDLAARQPIMSSRYPTAFLAPHLADTLRAAHPDETILATTLDIATQQRLESIGRQVQQQLEPGASLAALVVNNKSHGVVAHLGSGDYLHGPQMDLTRVVRSPGSTLKPFIYGLGFEQNIIHPETRLLDSPQRFGTYRPKNFDNTYHGWISVREALHASLNIPVVLVLARVGPHRLTSRFASLGIDLHYQGLPGLPLALGGVGCSLEDLVGLYSSLANGGQYHPLQFMQGDAPGRSDTPLLSPAAAWYVDDILKKMPFAAEVAGRQGLRFKTGTSYGFRDAWAIGYNEGYTVGVWVGRPDGGYGQSGTGSSRAVPVMLKIFAAVPEEPAIHVPGDVPEGVLMARHNHMLPPALQQLSLGEGLAAQEANGPRILFPVHGSRLPLKKDERGQYSLTLKADGGAPPLHWLVDGKPLGSGGLAPNDSITQYQPKGPGQSRITLVDSRGRLDKIQVWLE